MSKDDHKPETPAESRLDRRGFLKATAATAAGAYAMGAGSGFGLFNPAHAAEHPPIGNYPVKGDTVTYGFCVPLTGAYSEEGKDQLRAFKLAVEHINNGGGMLNTMKPLALKGNGVLGKKVKYVTGDAQTDPDAARATGRRMIERDGAIMFSGGSSSAVAIAQQYLAQDKGVIFMVGLSGSSDTTGKDRRRYGFRHFFHALQTSMALAPVLAEEFGKDRKAFHLTADYTWGHSQYDSMKEYTEKEGWTTVKNIYTPLGEQDFSQYLTQFLNSDADVLVLNEYGNDASNSMVQAARFGIRDMKRNGKKVEVVVPLLSRLMAGGAGDAAAGVYGTSNWSHELDDPGSKAVNDAFVEKYGQPMSQAAETAYVQTIVYSDAVERVGSFYTPDVIKAIEDYDIEGIGPGVTTYRGCDHQALHDIVVVQGTSADERDSEYELLKMVKRVPREEVDYACDYFPGEL